MEVTALGTGSVQPDIGSPERPGYEMDHLVFYLQRAGDPEKRRRFHEDHIFCVNMLPHHHVDEACLVFESEEGHSLCRSGSLPADDEARIAHVAAVARGSPPPWQSEAPGPAILFEPWRGDALHSLAEQLRSYNPQESEMIQGIFLFARRRTRSFRRCWQRHLSVFGKSWAVFDVTHKAIQVAAGVACAIPPARGNCCRRCKSRSLPCMPTTKEGSPRTWLPLKSLRRTRFPSWKVTSRTCLGNSGSSRCEPMCTARRRHRLAGKAQSDLALFLRNEAAQRWSVPTAVSQ